MLAVEREKDVFLVTTSAGRFSADAVFLATSLYGEPSAPLRRAGSATPSLRFTRPSIAAPRRCRRAPSSWSGLASPGRRSPRTCISTGRKVHLVTGNAPRCARFYRGRDVVDWLTDIGQYEITVADEGMGRKRQDTNHYLTGRDGGRDIDLGLLRNRACRSMGV